MGRVRGTPEDHLAEKVAGRGFYIQGDTSRPLGGKGGGGVGQVVLSGPGNLGDWDQVWGLEALGLMTKQIFKRI